MTIPRFVPRAASAFLVVAALAGAGWAGWSDVLDRLSRVISNAQYSRPARSSGVAVAAVRGWSAEEAANDTERRDYKAIKRLDKAAPGEAELRRFLEDGGLAP